LTVLAEILHIFDIHRIEILEEDYVALAAEECASATVEFHSGVFRDINHAVS